MRIESEYDREERRARAGVAVGVALLMVAVGFGLVVRFRPEVARALVPLEGGPATAAAGQPHSEETATLEPASSADSARPAPDTALPTMFALLQDTSTVRARSPGRRAVVTDVILLPCSTANPRPDGSIIIPPHNPRHRTIVGLPQKPGDPPRGFVVPPITRGGRTRSRSRSSRWTRSWRTRFGSLPTTRPVSTWCGRTRSPVCSTPALRRDEPRCSGFRRRVRWWPNPTTGV